MCNPACIDFAARTLALEDVRGRRVIEVGSMNVNGSVRATLEALGPARYVGVDLARGPGVDEVCPAEDLVSRFGAASFDVVVSTEMLEHVREWWVVVANLKQLVAPGGVLLITTRSKGFPYHEYPYDYWRYELDDMRALFADFTIEALETDTFMPGVFMRARRDDHAAAPPLEGYRLWSIVAGRRCRRISALDTALFRLRYPVERFFKDTVPQPVKDAIRSLLPGGHSTP
jgi:SAM-dependent methyltransferase